MLPLKVLSTVKLADLRQLVAEQTNETTLNSKYSRAGGELQAHLAAWRLLCAHLGHVAAGDGTCRICGAPIEEKQS